MHTDTVANPADPASVVGLACTLDTYFCFTLQYNSIDYRVLVALCIDTVASSALRIMHVGMFVMEDSVHGRVLRTRHLP